MNDLKGLNIPTSVKKLNILVISQSLVAKTYRSFYCKLADLPSVEITLVSPKRFRELGFQLIESPDFDPPFNQPNGCHRAFRLSVFSPHVQIVVFWGLTKIITAWLKNSRRRETRPIVMCLAEPYSITGLCAFLSVCIASLLTGAKPLFLLHALQNIFKQFPAPLRLIQAFQFRVNPFMLATGVEQKDVLRKQGYNGTIIDFPLWFDSMSYEAVRSVTKLQARQNLMSSAKFSAEFDPKFIVGYAGSFLQEKGIDSLLKAFKSFSQQIKRPTALWLCGRGPEEERLTNEFAKLQGEGFDIRYFGALPSAQMPTFYRSLDVLAVPSLTATHWKEQFGRIIIEARAAGTPVIGSNSGEIPHVIGSRELIFKEGDSESLTQVLQLVESSIAKSDRFISSVCSTNEQFADFRLAKSLADQLWSLTQNPR